ncbi:MAG: hypothetical protein WAQ28_09365 [Bacteroidia bacterium]
MQQFRKNIIAIVLLMASASVFAQVQVRITLKDDNIISGTVQLSKITLVTDYGKLEIPAKNVSGIRLGVKPEDEENGKPIDIVEIDNTYSMAGQTNIKTLDVKTDYGMLSIPGDKIERMEVYMVTDGQSTFKLMASKHISSNTPGGWLNTGIMLKKGENFTITANGQVVFASLSGAKYTPDGKVAGTSASNYDYPTVESGDNAYPNYGNVVYKIGEQGTMLKAGDKFSGTSPDYGVLYLSIYEVMFNPANTGSYIVKVERK